MSTLFEPSSGATFSPCGNYRYHLWRQWSAARSVLAIIMLNPSDADALKNDPTIRRCIQFARDWGHSGIDVGNLYALRSTDPKALKEAADAGRDPIGLDNDAALQRICAGASRILVAWGAHSFAQERAQAVLKMISGSPAYGRPVFCLGKTNGGSPRHPLYIKASQPLVAYP